MVSAIVELGVHPVVRKSKSPWGKTMPGPGRVGGIGAAPGGGPMNCGVTKEQPAPPPVKLTVIVPVPVALGAEKFVTAGAIGVTLFDEAEAALVPTALVAVTVK